MRIPAALTCLVLALPLLAQAPPPRGVPAALRFEENRGRYDEDVAFVARGRGYQFFLTRHANTLALRRPGGDGITAAVRTRFVGADPDVVIQGEEELATRVHHISGREPSGWHTGNRTFGRVRYRGIWPGIDLVLYDREGELEFDFIVAPGTDPATIRLAHDGVDARRIDGDGDLVLRAGDAELRESAPVLYQPGGDRVEGRFVLHEDGTVGFAVGAYDEERPLVIDPVLVYASYLGGSSLDAPADVAVGPSGDAYLCGWTTSVDLPGTVGTFQPSNGSAHTDAMVARISADGTTLLWCTYLGGSAPTNLPSWAWDLDRAYGIDVDPSGHVYVGGRTSCSDFPTTPGVIDTFIPNGDHGDGFVAKLLPDGSGLVWSTLLGNGFEDVIADIQVDATGHVFVTGWGGSQFPVTPGAFQTTSTSWNATAVVAKIAPAGNALVYSSFLGETVATFPGGSRGYGLHVDSAGRCYVAGITQETTFPTANAFQPSLGGLMDGFLVRLSADGSTMEYGTYLGGTGSDGMDIDGSPDSAPPGTNVVADDQGRAWFLSDSNSLDYPVTPGAFPKGPFTGPDAVITCLDTNASGAASMVWSTYYGTGQTTCHDIGLDAAGNAYVLGHTGAFSLLPLAQPWRSWGLSSEMFLAVFDPGGALTFGTLYGGNGADNWGLDHTGGLALDADENVYIVSSTSSTDLGTPGAFQGTNPSANTQPSGFLAKFTALGSNAGFGVRTPCTGAVPTGSLSPVTGAVLGQVFSVALGDPAGVTAFPAGGDTLWVVSVAPDPAYPCGTVAPGWGLAGGDAELLVDLTAGYLLMQGQAWSATAPAVYSLPVPAVPALDGVTLYTQGALLAAGGTQAILTEGLDVTVGQ